MASLRRLFPCFRWLILGLAWLLGASHALAQKQDRSLFDRIMHPDQELRAEGFDRAYVPASSGTDRSATVKPFPFNRSAANKGDGTFHTRQAGGDKGYRVSAYTTKASAYAQRGEPLADRVYDTKTMAVKEDRDAKKAADSRVYEPSSQVYNPHGKRQEEIDDLRRQKNLTSEQVREILNKNK